MSPWNDPQRDDNAAALRRRLASARTGKPETSGSRRLLAALLIVGVLGVALVLVAAS